MPGIHELQTKQANKQTEQQKSPSPRQGWSRRNEKRFCLLSPPVPFHCDGRGGLPGRSYPRLCLTSREIKVVFSSDTSSLHLIHNWLQPHSTKLFILFIPATCCQCCHSILLLIETTHTYALHYCCIFGMFCICILFAIKTNFRPHLTSNKWMGQLWSDPICNCPSYTITDKWQHLQLLLQYVLDHDPSAHIMPSTPGMWQGVVWHLLISPPLMPKVSFYLFIIFFCMYLCVKACLRPFNSKMWHTVIQKND